jgi:peptidoglycan hydrolase-like protein with peptidoglycan-binding domain
MEVCMAITVLQRGSKGPEVVDLQYLLIKRGGIPAAEVTPDGEFGPRTQAAVIKFQKAKGLNPDGVVGAMTWNATGVGWPATPGEFLREGDRGDAVKELQSGLISKQFGDVRAADGVFGPITKAAVLEVQTKSVQLTNQSGVVGPFTFGAAIGG